MHSRYLWFASLLLVHAVQVRQEEELPEQWRRRGRQAAAVFDNHLYINGGEIADWGSETYYVPINGTYWIPLDRAWNNTISSIEINLDDPEGAPPPKRHATLWANEAVYRWGGALSYEAPADENPLWRYSRDEGWSEMTPANSDEFNSIFSAAGGAGTVCGDLGVYIGGVGDSSTDPRFEAEVPIAAMALYNMTSRTWSRASIRGEAYDPGTMYWGQAVCATGFERDLVVALGGNESPTYTTNIEERRMREFRVITFYDPVEDAWHTQEVFGDEPPVRDFFCAIGVQSSNTYDIFIYGGRYQAEQGGQQRDFVRDDVWVLSLPAFRWFPLAVDPFIPARMLHTCAVQGRQMIISGGVPHPNPTSWHEQDEWENSIAVLDLSRSHLAFGYDPDLGDYEPPQVVQEWYNSNPNPVASLDESIRGFFEPRSTETETPNRSSSETPVGAIVGGAVGGVVGLALIGVAIFLFRRRQKAEKAQRDSNTPLKPDSPQLELQGYTRSELPPDFKGQRVELPDERLSVQGPSDAVRPLSELPDRSDFERMELA